VIREINLLVLLVIGISSISVVNAETSFILSKHFDSFEAIYEHSKKTLPDKFESAGIVAKIEFLDETLSGSVKYKVHKVWKGELGEEIFIYENTETIYHKYGFKDFIVFLKSRDSFGPYNNNEEIEWSLINGGCVPVSIMSDTPWVEQLLTEMYGSGYKPRKDIRGIEYSTFAWGWYLLIVLMGLTGISFAIAKLVEKR